MLVNKSIGPSKKTTIPGTAGGYKSTGSPSASVDALRWRWMVTLCF